MRIVCLSSHQGLHCLLQLVCPHTLGTYGFSGFMGYFVIQYYFEVFIFVYTVMTLNIRIRSWIAVYFLKRANHVDTSEFCWLSTRQRRPRSTFTLCSQEENIFIYYYMCILLIAVVAFLFTF